jgi:hypothetical protein
MKTPLFGTGACRRAGMMILMLPVPSGVQTWHLRQRVLGSALYCAVRVRQMQAPTRRLERPEASVDVQQRPLLSIFGCQFFLCDLDHSCF